MQSLCVGRCRPPRRGTHYALCRHTPEVAHHEWVCQGFVWRVAQRRLASPHDSSRCRLCVCARARTHTRRHATAPGPTCTAPSHRSAASGSSPAPAAATPNGVHNARRSHAICPTDPLPRKHGVHPGAIPKPSTCLPTQHLPTSVAYASVQQSSWILAFTTTQISRHQHTGFLRTPP